MFGDESDDEAKGSKREYTYKPRTKKRLVPERKMQAATRKKRRMMRWRMVLPRKRGPTSSQRMVPKKWKNRLSIIRKSRYFDAYGRGIKRHNMI